MHLRRPAPALQYGVSGEYLRGASIYRPLRAHRPHRPPTVVARWWRRGEVVAVSAGIDYRHESESTTELWIDAIVCYII